MPTSHATQSLAYSPEGDESCNGARSGTKFNETLRKERPTIGRTKPSSISTSGDGGRVVSTNRSQKSHLQMMGVASALQMMNYSCTTQLHIYTTSMTMPAAGDGSLLASATFTNGP